MIPFPGAPSHLLEGSAINPVPVFEAAHEVKAWAFETFISEESELYNPDHSHLSRADVLFVWSSVCFKSKGFEVVGTCQLGEQTGSKGSKEFAEWNLRQLNEGKLPDFVITLCAPFFAECDSTAICAVIEHELYHAKQKKDKYGVPMRHRTGSPVYEIQGHDVEEHLGVARRYGAWSPSLEKLREYLNAPPEVPRRYSKDAVCGCGARI
ncbi:hypothetical protein EON81_02925 [bacterium]|nr:MAG: hypothetical protein EON81_02925 [bacterium]